jgi:hypothetical protein
MGSLNAIPKGNGYSFTAFSDIKKARNPEGCEPFLLLP